MLVYAQQVNCAFSTIFASLSPSKLGLQQPIIVPEKAAPEKLAVEKKETEKK